MYIGVSRQTNSRVKGVTHEKSWKNLHAQTTRGQTLAKSFERRDGNDYHSNWGRNLHCIYEKLFHWAA